MPIGRDEQFERMAHDLGAQRRRHQEEVAADQRALERAMHEPHSVEDITQHATGVAEIGPMQRAIVVATRDGKQRRIHVVPQTARDLARALGAPFEGESEDGAAPAES